MGGLSAILGILSALAQAFVQALSWLHDRELVDAGKAQSALVALREQIDAANLAIAARESVRLDALRNDGRVPDDDPFVRD